MFCDVGGVRCGDVGLVLVCDVWVLVLVCHADPSNSTTSHRVSI